MFSQHPTDVTAERGYMVTFKCRIKQCDGCIIRWIGRDIATGLSISPAELEIDEHSRRSVTSELHMLAVNSSVVQCWEVNSIAAREIEKSKYSAFALLRVLETQNEGTVIY